MIFKICLACERGDHSHCLGGENPRPSLVGSGWVCSCAFAKHKFKIEKEKDPLLDALDEMQKKKKKKHKKRKGV